jgi:hypothetical protein
MRTQICSSVIVAALAFGGVADAQVPVIAPPQRQTPQRRRPPSSATRVPPITAEQTALRLAGVYEEVHELAKAEEQFVMASRSQDPKLVDSAVEGLRRVRAKMRQEADETALATAKEYEHLGRWELAQSEYAAAIKATSGAVRQSAVDGLRKVDRELSWNRAATVTDAWVLWVGKGVAVVLVVLWLPTVWSWVIASRGSIKVFPFIAPSDEAGKEILFWLAYARSKLRGRPEPPPGAVLMVAASSLPYIDLPNLPSEVTDIANLDLGTGKVGLKDALQVVARPKTRISGGWVRGTSGGLAYAELEARHWRGYGFQSRVVQPISAAGQAADLELFGYDVLIHAVEAHGR